MRPSSRVQSPVVLPATAGHRGDAQGPPRGDAARDRATASCARPEPSLSPRRALEVQPQKPLKQLLIANGHVPTVSGEDGGVELLVGQVEPGRTLVVEVRQGPLLKARGESGSLGTTRGQRTVPMPRAFGSTTYRAQGPSAEPGNSKTSVFVHSGGFSQRCRGPLSSLATAPMAALCSAVELGSGNVSKQDLRNGRQAAVAGIGDHFLLQVQQHVNRHIQKVA